MTHPILLYKPLKMHISVKEMMSRVILLILHKSLFMKKFPTAEGILYVEITCERTIMKFSISIPNPVFQSSSVQTQ